MKYISPRHWFYSTLIALILLLGISQSMATEEAAYAVDLKEDNFELRTYEPQIVAETIVTGDVDKAGSKAFRKLFRYISGNNEKDMEIAMTAPVGQEPVPQDSVATETDSPNQWSVSFMMPADMTVENTPKPSDEAVTIRSIPERKMASIRYSGRWSESGYEEHKSKLMEWVASKELKVVGPPQWARYNSPMMPWFMRRNEVLVPVE